jgi:hypothetical protein
MPYPRVIKCECWGQCGTKHEHGKCWAHDGNYAWYEDGDVFAQATHESESRHEWAKELGEPTKVTVTDVGVSGLMMCQVCRTKYLTQRDSAKGIRERTRERLAALEHRQWSHWMRYMFSRCIRKKHGDLHIPLEMVQRWERQMNTPYEKLDDMERQSDRSWADKVLDILLPEVQNGASDT